MKHKQARENFNRLFVHTYISCDIMPVQIVKCNRQTVDTQATVVLKC